MPIEEDITDMISRHYLLIADVAEVRRRRDYFIGKIQSVQ